MKKLFLFGCLALIAVMAVFLAPIPAHAATPTIVWLNPPPGGVLTLHVGETYVLNFEVTSDEEFIGATAMPSAYYPGRYVFFNGADHIGHGTSGVLSLDITGKSLTDSLPGGAPVYAYVAVRYPGGVRITQDYAFQVVVVP